MVWYCSDWRSTAKLFNHLETRHWICCRIRQYTTLTEQYFSICQNSSFVARLCVRGFESTFARDRFQGARHQFRICISFFSFSRESLLQLMHRHYQVPEIFVQQKEYILSSYASKFLHQSNSAPTTRLSYELRFYEHYIRLLSNPKLWASL